MQYARGRHDVMPAIARVHPQALARPIEVSAMLRLQKTAGNAAVQRLIQLQRDADRDADRDQQLATTVAGGDWTGAATILLAAEERWMVQRLHSFGSDQLRYLDDAVRRMHVINSRLRIFIKAGLMQLGATDDTSDPGAGFGVIEGKATKIKDGKIRAGGNRSASYRFEITFQPNAGAVDATLIEFIQMAKVVSTVHSTPDATGRQIPDNAGANGFNRQTTGHARVDQFPGGDYGWIGIRDSGKPDRDTRPWTSGSKSPAWMTDTPWRPSPNVTFDFETAAICREGKDQGTVYATVQWGFTIDATMKVIPKDTKYFNKESSEFDLAVAFWNAEPAITGSAQHQLPDSLR